MYSIKKIQKCLALKKIIIYVPTSMLVLSQICIFEPEVSLKKSNKVCSIAYNYISSEYILLNSFLVQTSLFYLKRRSSWQLWKLREKLLFYIISDYRTLYFLTFYKTYKHAFWIIYVKRNKFKRINLLKDTISKFNNTLACSRPLRLSNRH